METIRLLRGDHQEAVYRLSQLRRARDSAAQRRRLRQLKDELEVHTRIEEEIFYPALRDPQGRDLRVDEALADHEPLRALLSHMDQVMPGSDPWVRSLEVLQRDVERHIEMEERELFPRARAVLSLEAQEQLFQRLAARKLELTSAGERMSTDRDGPREQAERVAARTPEQTQAYARKMGEQGEAAAAEGAGIAAEQTRRAADALYETSDNLRKRDQESLSQYLRSAANGLSQFSNRLAEGDVDELLQETRATAERNPALLLGGAIAAGFLLTRFVKASADRPEREAHAGGETSHGVSPGAPAPMPTPSGMHPSSVHPQETR